MPFRCFTLAALSLFSVLVISGAAQAPAWTVDGPNAALEIRGRRPDAVDPSGHEIRHHLPGTLDLSVVTGANAEVGVLLLASLLEASPQAGLGAGALPWDATDAIDIGAAGPTLPTDISVLGDGLNPAPGDLSAAFFQSDGGNAFTGDAPRFRTNWQLGVNFDGGRVAFQAIVRDPSRAPFFLDTTSAANVSMVRGFLQEIDIVEDNSEGIAFPPGFSFPFHGASYSSVRVNDNGYLNFGAPTSVNNGGFAANYQALANAEPFIAVHQCDWNPGVISAELVRTRLRIRWGDPDFGGDMAHAFAPDTGNVFSAELVLADDGSFGETEAGAFTLDHENLVGQSLEAFRHSGTGARGHGPGGAPLFTVAARDLAVPTSSGPGETALEEHAPPAPPTVTPLQNGWGANGLPRGYNNADRRWQGTSVEFTPVAGPGLPGANGYDSLPVGPPAPADVQSLVNLLSGAVTPGLRINQGGNEVLTFSGSFATLLDAQGADPSGLATVVFDPQGVAGIGPLDATFLSILDSSGRLLAQGIPSGLVLSGLSGQGRAHRDLEACRVLAPALPPTFSGDIDVAFRFASGEVMTTTVRVASATSVIIPLGLGVNQAATVSLSGAVVSLYGNLWSTIYVGSNGQVTLGRPAADNGVSLSAAHQGFGGFGFGSSSTIANPGVAPLWLPLNEFHPSNNASYEVEVDFVAGTTKVRFVNQLASVPMGVPVNIGTWSVLFGPGPITHFDYSGLTLPNGLPRSAIIAYTDGDQNSTDFGSFTDLSDGMGGGFAAALGTYQTGITPGTFAPDSIGEVLPVGSNPALLFPNGITITEMGPGNLQILP